jgi:hypothetical protein
MRHSHAMIEAVRVVPRRFAVLDARLFAICCGHAGEPEFWKHSEGGELLPAAMAQAFATDTRAYPQTAVMSEWLTNGIVGTDAIRAIASVNVSLALVRLLFLVPLAIGKPGRINRKTDGLHVASHPPLRPRNLHQFNGCKPYGQFFFVFAIGNPVDIAVS